LVQVFEEGTWERLIRRIDDEQCTPFIGAGASAEYIPVASTLAEDLAREYEYPFNDTHDLARVTQFAAVQTGDRLDVKQRLAGKIKKAPAPDFGARDQPHALLTELGFPIYLTTNYDDFMYEALKACGLSPQRVICPWYTRKNSEVEEVNNMFQEAAGYAPSKDTPIVYHLHGHQSKPRSLVLTEDDYIEFLVRISADSKLLPPVIQEALGNQMLLFEGFSRFWGAKRGANVGRRQAISGDNEPWFVQLDAPPGHTQPRAPPRRMRLTSEKPQVRLHCSQTSAIAQHQCFDLLE
jgi:SIR2-like domain